MPEFKVTLTATEVSWVIVTARDAEEAEYLADISPGWSGDHPTYERTTEEL